MANSALIDDLLKQFAENPRRVFARLANEYRKAGELDTAIEICRAHVPLQPTYISGYIVLGQALYESGQMDEARTTFQTALGLDPENLIALRQLGDIAKAGGDLDGARSWYRRLLEVDPQNPEIVTALQELNGPAPQQPAADVVSWSDIHPEQTEQPETRAVEAAPVEPAAPIAESFSAPPEPPVAAGGRLAGVEFDILSSFSTELPAPEPVRSDAVAPPQAAPAEGVAEPESVEPEVAPAASAAPEIPVGAAPEPEPSPSWDDAFAAPANVQEPFVAPELAPEPEPAPAPIQAAAEPAPRREEPVVPAFITETMAELYLQQGHREQALDIYRLLLAMRPDDASLRERVQRLQQPAGGGGTARSFFARFAERRPPAPSAAPSAAPSPVPSGAGTPEPSSPPDVSVAGTPHGTTTVEATPADVPVTAPSESVSPAVFGGLEELFPGRGPSPADERAASTLAGAYTSNGSTTGRPARAAEDALSLDDVFGGGHATTTDAAHVSYDQFFSKRDAAGATPAPAGEERAAPARGHGDDADLELFHAWLEGLKK